jgi:DNA-directed RNA polymerase subunit L
METIIGRVNLSNLRVEAHAGFHGRMNVVIVEHNPTELEFDTQYNVYKPLLDAELSVLDIIRKSAYTIEIENQDHVRDGVYRGFVNAVKSSTNHYNEEKQNAAYKIEVVIDHYGNITIKTMDEESVALNDFIQELRTEANAALLNLLGLNDWVDELEKENRKFEDLVQLRFKEVSKRNRMRMKDIRKDVDKAFRDMVYQIEALIRVKGMSKYETLVKEMNAINEHYKNILAQQKGRRDKNNQSENTQEETGFALGNE